MKQTFFYIALSFVSMPLTFNAEAQALSDNSTFSIEFPSGCAPFDVNITSLISLDPGVSRQYTYEDEEVPTLDEFHTYTQPGTYRIAQILGQDANKFDTLEITVFEAIAPVFSINQCSGNQAIVTVEDTNYDFYRVYFTANDSVQVGSGESTSAFAFGNPGTQQIRVKGFYNGAEENCGESVRTFTAVNALTPGTISRLLVTNLDSSEGAIQLTSAIDSNVEYDLQVAENSNSDFVFLQDLNSGGSLTISGLDTEGTYYCFRLSAFDACTNENVYSNIVCSTSLLIDPQNGFQQLNWGTGVFDDATLEIVKDGQLFANIEDLSQRSLADSLIQCGVENCYSITVRRPTSVSISQQVCSEGQASVIPPPISDISATIDGNNVSLSWAIEVTNPDVFRIRRSRGNQQLEEIATTSETSYNDENPGVDLASFTYDIFYEDACGNRSSMSNLAQTIFLRTSSSTGNAHQLVWNEYEGWFADVGNYFLQKLDATGNLVSEEKALNGLSAQVTLTNLDQEPVLYRVRAESLDEVPKSVFSNVLTFQFTPELFLPLAFSPNGDGLNDILEIKGTFVASFDFKIFNRWGEIIFFSDDRNKGWDGFLDQRKAPSGTYIYKLNYVDEQGRRFEKEGTVILVR
ncbi:MAG: gliding motility-associated C-terminal domain-containing protein [Cyclobacteriaceae bacterium]